jgi:hypothetical protein
MTNTSVQSNPSRWGAMHHRWKSLLSKAVFGVVFAVIGASPATATPVAVDTILVDADGGVTIVPATVASNSSSAAYSSVRVCAPTSA